MNNKAFFQNIKLDEFQQDILKINSSEENKRIVQKYLEKWKTYRDGKMQEQENALIDLFKTFPKNNNLQNVLVKVSCLNDFYSTNIKDTFSVAKVIFDLHIDDRLQTGDLNLVNDIAEKTKENAHRREYSFASKYCSFHKPEIYPIFDSRNETMLKFYKNKISEKPLELKKDYESYVSIINKYKSAFGLSDFSYKEIDRFNWTFCNTVMDKSEEPNQ